MPIFTTDNSDQGLATLIKTQMRDPFQRDMGRLNLREMKGTQCTSCKGFGTILLAGMESPCSSCIKLDMRSGKKYHVSQLPSGFVSEDQRRKMWEAKQPSALSKALDSLRSCVKPGALGTITHIARDNQKGK